MTSRVSQPELERRRGVMKKEHIRQEIDKDEAYRGREGPREPSEAHLPEEDRARREHLDYSATSHRSTGNPLVDTAVGFRSGKPPGNDLLQETLETTRQSLQEEERRGDWDPKTRKTAHDMGQLVTDTQTLLREKNSDEKMQSFIINLREAERELEKSSRHRKENLRRFGQQHRQEGRDIQKTSREVIHSLRELIRTLGTSRDFRSLLLDLLSVVQQVTRVERQRAKEGASTSGASTTTTPTRTTTVEPGTTSTGYMETSRNRVRIEREPENPMLSESEREAINRAVYSTIGSFESSGHVESMEYPGYSFRQSPSGLRTSELRESYYPGGSPVVPRPVPPHSISDAPKPPPTSGKSGDRTVDEAARDVGQEARATGQQFARDLRQGNLPIPEEKKREISLKLRHILEQTAQNPNYRRSVEGLLFLSRELSKFARQGQQQGAPNIYSEAPHLRKALNDAKSILGEFLGNQELDRFTQDIQTLSTQLSKDERARDFFRDIEEFLRDVMDDPTILEKDEYQQRTNHIFDLGRSTMNDPQYREEFQNSLHQGRLMLENFREDPTTTRLRSDFQALAKDLVMDEHGNPSVEVTREGIGRLSRILVPLFQKHLERIPIPRIESHSEKYDFAVDNLVLYGRDIMPEHIHVYVDNDTDMDTFKGSLNVLNEITLHIQDIEVHAHNFNFWYKKKTTPRIEDHGVANLDVWGKETEVFATWRLISKPGRPLRFRAHRAECHIRHLKLRIVEAKHNIMDKIFAPLFQGVIRRQAEKNIEDELMKNMNQFSDRINEALISRREHRSERVHY